MQSDRLSTNLTNEQIEGIRAHELEFKRIVKIVHEKYEARRKAKENLWNSEKGSSRQVNKQAPKN